MREIKARADAAEAKLAAVTAALATDEHAEKKVASAQQILLNADVMTGV